MASRDRDDALAGLLRRNLAGDADAGNHCPAPDILAAYFEDSLDPEETARYELHFSQCARCREQLAALNRAGELAGASEATTQRAQHWAWLWDWRWLAPAAAAVLLFAVVWFARRPAATRFVGQPAEQPLIAMSQPGKSPMQEPLPQANASVQSASPQLTAPAPSAVPATPPHSPVAKSPSAKLEAPAGNARSVENLPLSGRDYVAPSKTATAPPRDSKDQAAFGTPLATTESVTVESTAPVIAPSAGPASLAPSASEAKEAPTFVAGAAAGGVAGGAVSARKKQEEGTRSLVQQAQTQSMYQSRALALAADNERSAVIHTPDAKVLWRIAGGGFVEQSKDGGATWQGQLPNANAHLVAGSAPGPNVCWFVGDDGIILLTQDAERWQTVRPPLRADFTAVTARDASTVTVTAADGRKFITTDRGKTWTSAP